MKSQPKSKTRAEFANRKIGEAKATREIAVRIDTILFETEAEMIRAAQDIPLEMNRKFYFESGKVAGLNEAVKRLQDLRGLVVGERDANFKVKGKK